MKDFLETTMGKILLGAVVVVIWGVNVVNISDLGVGKEQVGRRDVQKINMSELTVPAKIQYEYVSSGRDPFSQPNSRPVLERSPITEVKVEQKIELPPLTLNGIVEGMAVISDMQGFTHLVKRNDSFLQNIYVMHIWADSVLLEYQDKKFTLKIN